MNFDDWYKDISKKYNLSSNPDDFEHYYDYRAAFDSGIREPVQNSEGQWKWPSQFKHDLHPERFKAAGDGVFEDTKNNTYVTESEVKEVNMKRLIYKMLQGLPDKVK